MSVHGLQSAGRCTAYGLKSLPAVPTCSDRVVCKAFSTKRPKGQLRIANEEFLGKVGKRLTCQ